MGMAFDVTAEDVHTVLQAARVRKSLEECERILDLIDSDEVERAALYGDDLDQQTVYAHEKIHEQLVAQGLIVAASTGTPSLDGAK